jgi:hypothetical protein
MSLAGNADVTMAFRLTTGVFGSGSLRVPRSMLIRSDPGRPTTPLEPLNPFASRLSGASRRKTSHSVVVLQNEMLRPREIGGLRIAEHDLLRHTAPFRPERYAEYCGWR